MIETRLKRITLLILEIFLLQRDANISDTFAYLFNGFIYRCYEENKELLSTIYDIELLKEFIEGNYEILSGEEMVILINKYHGFQGYVQLVEDVGKEADAKLNELALMFINYAEEFMNLYNEDPYKYYSKGITRILQ